MFAIGIAIFTVLMIALELYTGHAVVGWAGDNMVVERKKSPGPYWFAIVLHFVVGIGLPIFLYVMILFARGPDV